MFFVPSFLGFIYTYGESCINNYKIQLLFSGCGEYNKVINIKCKNL